jgi:hypothetical protein
MITLTLTAEQLATVERALNNYTYDLILNFEAGAVRDDERRLVQEALDVIQPALLDYAWDKTKYPDYEDYLHSLGADY